MGQCLCTCWSSVYDASLSLFFWLTLTFFKFQFRHHLPLPHTLNSLRLNSTMRTSPFISWHILLKQIFNLFPSPVYQLWWGKTPCFIHLLCFLESNTIHGILIYSFWSEWLSPLLFLLNKNVPRLYEISWFQFKWTRHFTMNIWLPNIF